MSTNRIPPEAIEAAMRAYGRFMGVCDADLDRHAERRNLSPAWRSAEAAIRAAFDELGLRVERMDRWDGDAQVITPEERFLSDWRPVKGAHNA